ncbi:caldesmon-like [Temnothorax curvispinosus]|uniref:Caldesmon-like n=1 Tax=Temnothorax curvispinosus TaxID=300111 RepID=A0A6J1PHD3_9HYME|nr:caldesmon-like [Temnothorax curvispinosus]
MEKIEKLEMKGAEENEGRELIGKMKEIEKSVEMTERRRRKNNIIVKEKLRNVKERKENFEKLMAELNTTEGSIEEIQEIGYGEYKIRLLKCKNWEVKRDIMKKKKELGRKYGSFLDDDLTKQERQIQTEIKKIADWRRGKTFIGHNEENENKECEEDEEDRDFWDGVKKWDVIIMMETWMDKKGWEKMKEKLPKEFGWRVQIANKRNKKGRTCGEMLVGIRKGLEEIKEGRGREEEENRVEVKLRIKEEIWKIIGIYVNKDIDKKLEGLNDCIEEGKIGVRTIIGEFIEERGLMILNDGMKGDEKGEYTYTGGKGETVIDYIISDEDSREKIERLEIGDRVESDHHPLILWIRGGAKRTQRGEKIELTRRRGIWSEEGRKHFVEKLGKIGGNRKLQEEIEEGVSKIRGILKENEKGEVRGANKIRRRWWDEECKEKKKEARAELRKWRKGKGEVERYRERKRKYREVCERKKKEEKEKMITEIGEARSESKVWELIGRVRKRKKRINEDIGLEKWKKYFMELMGGVENRVVKGEGGRDRQDEEEIELEEVRNVIKKLKTGKAIGKDGIPNKVWKYGGEEMVR